MEPKFKKGAVVKLNSGGLNMTIKRAIIENPPNDLSQLVFIGNYWCSWFEDGKYAEKKFHEDLLQDASIDDSIS